MRILLALWVIVFHQSTNGGSLVSYVSRVPAPFDAIFKTGYAAVGAFFVLSGFILAYNYDLALDWDKPRRLRFFIARFSRVYPVYLLGILLMVPFYIGPMLGDPFRELRNVLLQVMLLQSWIPSATGVWNSPGWSLSDEAFFYVLFPVLGVAIWRLARLKSLITAIALLWAMSVAVPFASVLLHIQGLDISAVAPSHHPFLVDLVRFNPLLRLPEFLIGIATAKIYILIRSQWANRGYWFYVPSLCLALVTVLLAAKIPYPVMHNGLLDVANSGLILGLALGGGPLTAILSKKPLVFLGGASYSMYILQVPIRLFIDRIQYPAMWMDALVYFAAVIIVSSFVFVAFEEPMHAWVKKKLGAGKRTSVAIPEAAMTKGREKVATAVSVG